MSRGNIVTVTLTDACGKPGPTLIIQSDFFNTHPAVIILPITTELRKTLLFRVTAKPSKENGLHKVSQIMVDKAHTVPRGKLSASFGKLEHPELLTVNRLLAVFLRFG